MTLAPGRVLQVVAGIIPAILIVVFVGLATLIALVLDSDRRQYALDLADRFADLASVLVGVNRPRRPRIVQPAKPSAGAAARSFRELASPDVQPRARDFHDHGRRFPPRP